MPSPTSTNDWLTAAAIGVLAMCVVTFDHEALGHGSVCILLHGHIRLLTSALFRCDIRSGWIDPAGPASNLVIGTIALLCRRFVPKRAVSLRFFLILITAFSYFWESGYLIRAMLKRDGDLYYFAQFLLGDVSLWQRWLAAAIGLAFYVSTARLTSNALLQIWPQAHIARIVARTALIAATLGAALAALAHVGNGWDDLRDSILEIGGGSFPLLFIPMRSAKTAQTQPSAVLTRGTAAVMLSAITYAAFVASLGRGITF